VPLRPVSGVGHETDFTIADFVADERAPTPTAAAQRVAPDRRNVLKSLHDQAQHLHRAQRNRLQNAMQTLDYLQRNLVHPAQQLQRRNLQLEQLKQHLQRAFAHGWQHQFWRWQSFQHRLRAANSDVVRLQDRWISLEQRLNNAMRTGQAQRLAQADNAAQHLILLNPQKVLARGYSMVHDTRGKLVSDARQLIINAGVSITFANGSAWAQVKKIKD
jgi:exodeoxyribonuclease VII large subunit